MQKTEVHGFSSKLLTVPTVSGVDTYSLSIFQNSFEEDEKVVAIALRYNKVGLDSKSIEDRPLIGIQEVRNGYMTLVEDNGQNTNILNNHNLFMMTTESIEQDSYGIFIPPCEVKWTQSSVEFSDLSFDGTKDIEFNVYYITDCQKPIEPNILFDNGFQYNGVRKKTVQINAKSGEQSYAIKNNPIINCGTIVGLRYDEFDYKTIDGRTHVSKISTIPPITNPPTLPIPGALGASFLTMRVGSRNLLEDFPLTELRALYHLGYPYFPIEPTASQDFNWNQCKINLPSKALTQDNTCYLLTFYYM